MRGGERREESGERFLPVQSSYAQGRRLAESDLYIYMSPEESNDEMLEKRNASYVLVSVLISVTNVSKFGI